MDGQYEGSRAAQVSQCVEFLAVLCGRSRCVVLPSRATAYIHFAVGLCSCLSLSVHLFVIRISFFNFRPQLGLVAFTENTPSTIVVADDMRKNHLGLYKRPCILIRLRDCTELCMPTKILE